MVYFKNNKNVLEFINKINNFKKAREETPWSKLLDTCSSKIQAEQLGRLLRDPSTQKRQLVIDCRFDYEFRGGHIKSAVNINSP